MFQVFGSTSLSEATLKLQRLGLELASDFGCEWLGISASEFVTGCCSISGGHLGHEIQAPLQVPSNAQPVAKATARFMNFAAMN